MFVRFASARLLHSVCLRVRVSTDTSKIGDRHRLTSDGTHHGAQKRAG